jgi:mycofactocin system FadH/OYE family oxidoreductase 2
VPHAAPPEGPTTEFPHLLSPIRVGRLDLPNRVLVTAHATNYVDADNLPDRRAVHYYAERARGGVGLMVTGASSVHASSPTVRGVVNAQDERVVGAWRAIADAVHAEGGRILVMLTHMGRVGRMPDTRPLVAPSPLMDGNFRQSVPHELTPREIAELVSAFARAAARVRSSGMDGVELQGAHGYLIAQFLSPLSNRRADAYGGDLAGRMRFALEVVGAVRAAVGRDYTLGIRLSADELVPGGLGLEETREIVRRLEATGQLDFVDVSGGTDADLMSLAEHIPSMYFPPANLVHLAAAIKPVTGLPVFCAGAIREPARAEEIVARGQADLVGMTRAHIADPHVVAKLRAGRADDVRRCIGCMQACLEALANGQPIGCVYNPVTGREEAWAVLPPAPRPRRILVVGGGPGGLEAARVAALRGHRVVLLEAADRLGGQLRLAARLPKREGFLEVVRFLTRQVEALGVDVRLGQPADVARVRAEGPDAVVVATGSRPAVPADLAGGGPLVHVADVVRGAAGVGDRVLVVDHDSHLRGCGVADLLAGQGRAVRIASEQLYVGQGIDMKTLYPLYRRLREAGVEMLPSTRFAGWRAGQPVVADVFTGAARTLADVDTVVWAGPGRADGALGDALREAGLEVHAVGDCVAPRRVEHAVHEAHAVARGL